MNTRRLVFLFGFLGITALASAQNAYDALNFSQTDPVMGTARYSAMGGAMGALGGDASTMRDNPAGIGIYRGTELTFTPNIYIANDNSVGFNINNFSFILNFRNSGREKGYITSSLGFGYNRVKNFKRNTSFSTNDNFSMTDYIVPADGPLYDQAWDLWLVDTDGGSLFNPGGLINNSLTYIENGSIGEWNISYGVNISNRVYLGITTSFVDLDYSLRTMYDEFYNNGPDDNSWWYLDNYYDVSRTGFNFKIGAIVSATDFMRVGFSFHTPTFYNGANAYLSERMDHDNILYDDYASDEFNYSHAKFDLQTPLKLQGSLGFIVGRRALIGLEYQYEDFKSMRLSYDGLLNLTEKNVMKQDMNSTHTAKVGTEVRITDAFSVRAGFVFVSNPSTKLDEAVYTDPENFQSFPMAQPQHSLFYTAGIGYKGKFLYADLAYVHKAKKEVLFEFLPQEAYTPHETTLHNNNIMATIGLRF